MTLDAEEHYRLLLAIFKSDKELDDIAKILYERKEHVDGVLKESVTFMKLSKAISQNKKSDSRCASVKNFWTMYIVMLIYIDLISYN